MYTWNTGCSWITSSSPKLVAIWRWVDVCLKTVMFPGRKWAQQEACFGTLAQRHRALGRGSGPTSLVWKPLDVSIVGDHLVLRNHDFVLEGGGPESRWLEWGEASPSCGPGREQQELGRGGDVSAPYLTEQPYLAGHVDDSDQGGLRV